MEDMIQIRLAVEGLKAEIVKCFDAEGISKAIRTATEKAVNDFDMETFIKDTTEGVFNQAREVAITELSEKYGSQWADDLTRIIDDKIEQALKEDD